MSKFARGSAVAKERSQTGGNFPKAEYWRPVDGSVDGTAYILRFITDYNDWISVLQHSMVPTRPAPMKDGKPAENWPRTMGCVCRKTKDSEGHPWFEDCYVCDNGLVKSKGKIKPPSSRIWALACLREEVRDAQGILQGYKDKEREVAVLDGDGKPTGEVTTEKEIVFVNLGWKNFFAPLEGFGMRYGTVLDRDYWIKRIGDDTQTTYQIVPNDPQPFFKPVLDAQGQPVLDEAGNYTWEQDGIYDLRRPEVAKLYETRLSLEEEIDRQSSLDFIGHWFDPNYQREGQQGQAAPAQPGQPPAPAAPPAPAEPTSASLEAMRARVTGYAGGATQATTEAPAAPPAAAAPAQPPSAPQPPQPPVGTQPVG